jgi:TonB family protein
MLHLVGTRVCPVADNSAGALSLATGPELWFPLVVYGRMNAMLGALASATFLCLSGQLDAPASNTVPYDGLAIGRSSAERTKKRVPTPTQPANIRVGCDHSEANLIRITVRHHINEIKNCYELELQKDHGLAGRVAVQFSVMPAGSVSTATVASSTLGNEAVEACMIAATRLWQFPAMPDHHEVVVTYPFVLAPSEAPPKESGG